MLWILFMVKYRRFYNLVGCFDTLKNTKKRAKWSTLFIPTPLSILSPYFAYVTKKMSLKVSQESPWNMLPVLGMQCNDFLQEGEHQMIEIIQHRVLGQILPWYITQANMPSYYLKRNNWNQFILKEHKISILNVKMPFQNSLMLIFKRFLKLDEFWNIWFRRMDYAWKQIQS